MKREVAAGRPVFPWSMSDFKPGENRYLAASASFMAEIALKTVFFREICVMSTLFLCAAKSFCGYSLKTVQGPGSPKESGF
jgi:hypothetical protein